MLKIVVHLDLKQKNGRIIIIRALKVKPYNQWRTKETESQTFTLEFVKNSK